MAIGSALSTLESARFTGFRVSGGDDVLHLPKSRTSVLSCCCRLLPQEMGTTQRIFRCAGVSMESSSQPNTSKNLIVGKYFFGWSKEESISCQSLKKHPLPVGALLTSETPDVSTTPIVGEDKIGVLLLNLGGPETLDDVQPFLYNLFADPVGVCKTRLGPEFGPEPDRTR